MPASSEVVVRHKGVLWKESIMYAAAWSEVVVFL